MRKNSTYILILILILIVLSISYFFLRSSQKLPKFLDSVPGLRNVILNSQSTANQDEWPQTSKYQISVLQTETPVGFLVKVSGYFLNPLEFDDFGRLSGNFIVNGDDQKTPIQVLFTKRGGYFYAGLLQENGSVNFGSIKSEELQQKVVPNQEVELRFSLIGSGLNTEDMSEKLKKLMVDDKINANEYYLIPDMIDLGVSGEN